jgi:hypothetical protein
MCRVCNGEGIVRDHCIDHGPAGLLFCDCDEGRYRKADEYKHTYPQPASSAWLRDAAIDAFEADLKAKGLTECWDCRRIIPDTGRTELCDDCLMER